MARLSKIPNIIALKGNTTLAMSFYAMQRAIGPKDTVILCGNSELMFSFVTLYGCLGFVSSTANHSPHTGIPEAGGNIYVGVEKAAMDIVGLRGGEVRLPLVGLSEEEKAEFRSILKTMKIIK